MAQTTRRFSQVQSPVVRQPPRIGAH